MGSSKEAEVRWTQAPVSMAPPDCDRETQGLRKQASTTISHVCPRVPAGHLSECEVPRWNEEGGGVSVFPPSTEMLHPKRDTLPKIISDKIIKKLRNE